MSDNEKNNDFSDDEINDEELSADKVVLAVGRKGASWLSDVCKNHDIKTKIGSVDIGIRYELPDKVMTKINEYMYEGKFISQKFKLIIEYESISSSLSYICK